MAQSISLASSQLTMRNLKVKAWLFIERLLCFNPIEYVSSIYFLTPNSQDVLNCTKFTEQVTLIHVSQAREALLDAHEGRIPPLMGYYLGLSAPPLAKVVAQLGYDLVWIDWEHASTNVETMTQVSKTRNRIQFWIPTRFLDGS
jgi:hypothetical protein